MGKVNRKMRRGEHRTLWEKESMGEGKMRGVVGREE